MVVCPCACTCVYAFADGCASVFSPSLEYPRKSSQPFYSSRPSSLSFVSACSISLPPDGVIVHLTCPQCCSLPVKQCDWFQMCCCSTHMSGTDSAKPHWLGADLQPQSEEGQADVPDVELDSPMRSSLEIYKAMSLREKCRRCGVGFHRGANFANCSVHTGVMISGHRSNGISATWTCCGSKAHAKGCTMVHHVPDLSAITSSPNSSKSSAVTPERGRGDECRPWSARGGHSPNSSVTCLDMMLGNKVVQPPVLSLGD
jgi:hypothetical protein